MPDDLTPLSAPPDASTALHDELARERIRGMHRINLLRLGGVSAFFVLFLVMGGLLRLPAWTGNLELFAVYWAITLAVFWASQRFPRLAPLSCLAIALVDTPFVFLLQWSTFPTSPSASGVAGFTVGVYVLFVILATLSLETRYILLTAATGAAFEVLLQYLAGVSVGAMISTVLLLGVTTLACSYARDRLVGRAGRVETATQLEAASRRAEDRLRETIGLLGIAKTLGGVTEVNEALRRICRELAHLTGAETVAAYMVDRERAELRPTAGYRVPKDKLEGLAAMRVELSEIGFAPVLEKGDLLWSDDVATDSRLRPWSDRFPHRSALAIPSIVAGRVSAVFYLVWWTRHHSFDRAELTLAQAIGEQVGTFIQNAQLYEQLDESRQRSVQAERLRAVGEMAAGVAHDFNNILAIILGRAELLLRTTPVPEIRRPLDVIVKAAQDGARTVRRIKDFTRQSVGARREPVDLRALAKDVVEMTRARWHDQAEARGLRYDVSVEDGAVPPVLGDAADLREALTNLVFNALDAMPQGGRLTLRTALDGARVRCDVLDTGVGMSPELRERVFEPFFSTKTEKGSGLGLSIVYGIVTRLGGEIAVESTPGIGSVFRIWLPVAGERPAAPAERRPAAQATRGARILVVDDETEVRQALADMLELDGHVVVECPDGVAALQALDIGTFDLVLTDLGMPGLGGWDVARAVKQRHPGLPVGLITGWGDSIDAADATRRGVDFLLAKPFQMHALQEALAQALGARTR
jgi:signal transduction histidine kinase/ActR/RegA family two-component response regulator